MKEYAKKKGEGARKHDPCSGGEEKPKHQQGGQAGVNGGNGADPSEKKQRTSQKIRSTTGKGGGRIKSIVEGRTG